MCVCVCVSVLVSVIAKEDGSDDRILDTPPNCLHIDVSGWGRGVCVCVR